jgi:hypothetical protein
MANPSPPRPCMLSHYRHLPNDKLCSMQASHLGPAIPTEWSQSSHSVAERSPAGDKRRHSGLSLFDLRKNRIQPSNGHHTYHRIPGPTASCCMRHYSTALSSSDHNSSQKESVVPYANQNIDGAHPTGLAAIVDGQTQAWSDALQALVGSQILCS